MYLKSSLLIYVLPFTLSLKVFDFDGNINLEEKEISTLSLTNSIQLDRKFRICSSHRQLQLISDSANVYTLFEDEALIKPWFTMGFWTEADLWVAVKQYNWYYFGTYTLTIFRNWIHVCFEIDFDSKVIHGSVNGGSLITIRNVTALMDLPPPLYIGFVENI